jgi:hypothetical protein
MKAIKGMRDILPPESHLWGRIEEIARALFGSYGFEEIRTPVAEETELFVRGIGEGTDIVHKEMYTFEDRKGRSLTLRPEMTAGVVRALVERGLRDRPMPIRLWYQGPMFRYERPQRGRYRQFHQIGAELFGATGSTTTRERFSRFPCAARGSEARTRSSEEDDTTVWSRSSAARSFQPSVSPRDSIGSSRFSLRRFGTRKKERWRATVSP